MKESFYVSSGVDKLFLVHISNEKPTTQTPILLIHGVTYSSHVFDVEFEDYNFASMLSQAGHDVWLVDLPGYAASNHVTHGLDVTIEYAAQALKSAVDFILAKHHTDQIDLFGWSMGTVIGSAYALKHPEHVNRLILFAPIFTGLNIKGEALTERHSNTPEHAAEDFQRDDTGAVDTTLSNPKLVQAFVAQCMRVDGKGSPNGLRVPLLSNDTLIPAERLKTPTLIVAGSRDPYLNRSAFDNLQALKMPNITLSLIQGAGHAILFEIPFYKAFHSQVKEFLA